MTKIIIIAEKPSVARDIAKVLACKDRADGYLYCDKYIVTWAIGHLITLKEPDELDEKYKKWNSSDLPILPNKIPLKTIKTTYKQFKIIKELMNSADVSEIICATDAGREGELIFRLIYEYANCKKPFKRLWISSLTDDSIIQGFKNLKNGTDYNSLYYSSICRAYADWYIGMNASRLYSIKYNSNLSIGRVQTPTLALIVNRQKEIDSFVPVEYYILTANFGDYEAQWFDQSNGNQKVNKQISTLAMAEEIQNEIKNKTGVVELNTKEQNIEVAPQLFDLTSLQREANSQFGFTAKKTLGIAQELYEKYKLITYPRTDSRCLSDDMRVNIVKLLNSLPNEYSKFIPQAINGFKNIKGKRIFNNEKVSDHHAIIVTGKSINFLSLSEDNKLLLKLIVQRFISVFFPPCTSNMQKIITSVDNNKFICQGKTIVEIGWREIEQPIKPSKRKKVEKDIVLPSLNIGDTRKVKSASIKQDKTKAPDKYTDASLLSAMENAGKALEDDELKSIMKGSGLGTPATRAAIIERLIAVKYLQRDKKYLMPTEKAMNLIEIVPEILASPELTGNWELALNNIANETNESKTKSLAFLNDIRKLTNDLVIGAKDTNTSAVFKADTTTKQPNKKIALNISCPLCSDGEILENSKAFYCSNWKNACKFTIWKNELVKNNGPELDKKLVQLLFEKKELKGSTGIIKLEDASVKFYPN